MSTPQFSSLKSADIVLRDKIAHFEEACWDIQFYPYLINRDDPTIFVTVNYYYVFIYMVDIKEVGELKLLACHHMHESQRRTEFQLNSCTWCYIDEDEPLLALAGESGHILIVKPMTGELVGMLVGHGQGVINALKTHPKYPWIIASASLDTSIRIWDLRRMNDSKLSSCIVICGHGIAHKEALLTIDWHDSGRYIISGGFDYRVAVWTIPDLKDDSTFWREISKEGRKRSRDEVHIIYYPHFLSSAIHTDVVDNVKFIGDLILSRAAKEEKIVLWSVTGFDGTVEPPDSSTAVKTKDYMETVNGFVQKAGMYFDDDFFGPDARRIKSPELYKRCLQFKHERSESSWLRIAVSQPSVLFPEVRLTVSGGDHKSRVNNWDLQSFIDGGEQRSKANAQVKSSRGATSRGRGRGSRMGSTASQSRDSGEVTSTDATRDREAFPLHDPDRLLKPTAFKDSHILNHHMTIRAVAWSPCGRWCVAVGGENDHEPHRGAITLYERKHTT